MGSICTEGNIGQFEGIPYGSTAGYKNYQERTWNYPEYYLQFPHKYTNIKLEIEEVIEVGKFPKIEVKAEYEYANSYQHNLSMDTVIDKNLAIQLEVAYVKNAWKK